VSRGHAWAAGVALLLLGGALLDSRWVRRRVGRRARARLVGLYARARDRRRMVELRRFFTTLEDGGVALAMGATVSGFLFILLGLAFRTPDGAFPWVHVAASLPFGVGLFLAVISLLELLLLVPETLFLRALGLALEGVERLLRTPDVTERRPFTVAALLLVLLALLAVILLPALRS
jgi:hypothetical protein